MNRKYTISDFEKVVQRLRNLYEDVILTTDIIVGFPNETDEDFEITYNFLEKIKFYKMHVFKYSQRKGTVAAKMRNQISSDEKEKINIQYKTFIVCVTFLLHYCFVNLLILLQDFLFLHL